MYQLAIKLKLDSVLENYFVSHRHALITFLGEIELKILVRAQST